MFGEMNILFTSVVLGPINVQSISEFEFLAVSGISFSLQVPLIK